MSVQTEIVRYRYRAYPTQRQQRALSRLFGACRVVYNDALAYARAEHGAGRGFPDDIQHQVLTRAKHTPERAWLKESYGVCLIQSVNDAKAAYRNFFNSLSGKRKGRKVGAPRFKSRRDNHDAARFTTAARFTVEVDRDDPDAAWLVLPRRYGRLRFAYSRPLPSTPSSVTVIREPDGRYYVSFVVARSTTAQPDQGRVCGVDVGLATFATIVHVATATGEESASRIDTPAYLRRRQRALARSQRAHARTQAGSTRREKARLRVAVQHRKVREARLDHAHQQAARLVATHDTIVVEDLALTGMARTNLAVSLHDQALGQFLVLLAEKAARAGVRLHRVGRFYASTQICSTCEHHTGPKGADGLRVRQWVCRNCGAEHDRDINAARNILTEGLRTLDPRTVADGQSETQNARGRGEKTASTTPAALPNEPRRTSGDQAA